MTLITKDRLIVYSGTGFTLLAAGAFAYWGEAWEVFAICATYIIGVHVGARV